MNNLKLGVRLGIAFAISLILIVTLAVVGYSRIETLAKSADSLVNNRFPKTVQANNIIDAINNIARQLRNAYIVSGEESKKALDAIPEQRRIITENIEKLERTVVSDAGKAIMSRVKESRAAYVVQQDRFIELLKAGKRDEIPGLLTGDLRKTQSAYLKAVNDLIQM